MRLGDSKVMVRSILVCTYFPRWGHLSLKVHFLDYWEISLGLSHAQHMVLCGRIELQSQSPQKDSIMSGNVLTLFPDKISLGSVIREDFIDMYFAVSPKAIITPGENLSIRLTLEQAKELQSQLNVQIEQHTKPFD